MQVPLVTVHLRTAEVPAGTPVMSVEGDPGVSIVAVPDNNVHAPAPTGGTPCVIKKDEVLHND